MNVVPVINCPDAAHAAKALGTLEKFLPKRSLVHIDVTDGIFSAHRTWDDPFGWARLKAPFATEVHLMMEDPEEDAENWFAAGARRAVVHIESLTHSSFYRMLSLAERYDGEIVLSAEPDSDPAIFGPYINKVSAFHVLAVAPGASGQKFLPAALDTIVFLRQAAPDATIEVDGGINLRTAALAKAAGADTVLSSSYIFKSADPKKAYEELKKI